jgi:hypothetical protein
MATTDNNNMLIEYNPSQVGLTDAANPTNAANLTIAADSNPANPSDSSTTISDNHNVDSTVSLDVYVVFCMNFELGEISGVGTFDFLNFQKQIIELTSKVLANFYRIFDNFKRCFQFSLRKYLLTIDLNFEPSLTFSNYSF